MLKRETAIRKLIIDGYDDELATQLPKLFIIDFFEKSQDEISEYLDTFIDRVQRGYTKPCKDDKIFFGLIQKMGEKDMYINYTGGVFYNFRSQIKEEFTRVVRRQPLQDILLEGGAMKLHPEYASFSNNPVYFEKEIVEDPEEYRDLCLVSTANGETFSINYIMFSDLLSLIKSKGLSEDSISVKLDGEVNGSIYLKYDDVINLGRGNLKSIPHMLQKNMKDGK